MALIKFYKTGEKWVLGNYDGYPAGTCVRYIDEPSGVIYIRPANAPGNSDKAIAKGLPTEFCNASGVAYADLTAFKAATDDFFANNTSIDLSALISAIQSSGGSQFKSFTVEITRPANTTVYSANDVVADVSAAFLPFLNVAKAIGSGIKVIRVRIQTEDTGVAGKKFNLHLYRDAPTFIADNASFAVSYSNASKRIGAIPIVMGTGNMGTVGMNDYNNVIINPVARDVYFILETVDGFTPSANSTKFQVTIDCELSN